MNIRATTQLQTQILKLFNNTKPLRNLQQKKRFLHLPHLLIYIRKE